MRVMDKWCSGRRKCEVQVRDLLVEAQGKCTAELRGYLRANYTCQRGKAASNTLAISYTSDLTHTGHSICFKGTLLSVRPQKTHRQHDSLIQKN